MSIFLHKIPNKKKDNVTLADIDFGGVFLLAVSIVSLVLALSWGGTTYAWSSPLIIALLAVFGSLIPVFVLYENYVPHIPVIPLSMFRHRNVVTSTVNYLFIHMSLYGFAAYLPTYFQLVKFDSTLLSGLQLLPYLLPMSMAAIVVGILISRTGWVRPWLLGGGFLNLVGTGLCILFNTRTKKGLEFVFLVLTGIGMGFVYQSNTLSAQSQVSHGELASVTTMTMWSKSLGGIVGIAVQGSVIQNFVGRRVLADPVSAPVKIMLL